MVGLLECCRLHFGTDNLYDVLKLAKNASSSEIKRGYHKLSLEVHPDRVDENSKEEATEKFQTLGKLYSILSDKEKRVVYDDTGEVDDENDLQQDRDWFDYWRLLFPPVSLDDIKNFEKEYKGSEEEVKDLKSAYCEYKGDMDAIMDAVLCSSIEDEPRFRKTLTELINNKELPKYKKFTKEGADKKEARRRKADSEAAEAEAALAELGGGDGENSLRNMIMQRHQARQGAANDFFAQLEQKYAKPKKAKTSSKKK